MKISAKQLSALTGAPVGDCRKIIAVCHLRKAGHDDAMFKEGIQDSWPQTVDSEDLALYKGIDVTPFIKNIQKNYLRSAPTRAFIFNYPAKLIEKSDGKTLLTLKIPDWLECFLTKDQKETIYWEWEKRYNKYKNVLIPKSTADA